MVKSKEETAYLLQTCGDNFVIREFRADVKYDMVAYTKPVYNWRELRRYVFDKDLNFTVDTHTGFEYKAENE
jgi:hypothetical protein